MTSQAQELALADIHLQSVPSLFPLSLLGNITLIAVFVVLVMIIYFIYMRFEKNKPRKQALTRFSLIEKSNDLAQINALLKRVAISYSGRTHIAPLTGKEWFSYLDARLPESKRGFSDQEAMWINALYRGSELSAKELKHCKDQAKIWIKYATFSNVENQVSEGSIDK